MNPLESLAIELVANVKGFVTDANKAIDKVEKNANDSFGKIEKKATSSFGKVGKAIVGAVGGAALGFAVGTLGKRFAELDQTMAGVAARAGLTADQQDKLTDSTIKLSKANLQSQTEIALTGESLISLQGIEADHQEQIEKLTQQYLDYALVTGQTAPDAVAAFDDILDAWNLTAEDGITIMDALVVSHQKFGTDIVGAQGALNKYASTFQTLGLDVNDALGYINLFAASGVDAEASAAAFNKAVGLLTDGTDASNKKLAEMAANLGLTNDQLAAFDAADPAGKFDILTKAIAATEDPTIRAQAAIDLFGSKAGPKLGEALAGNGIEDFKINLDLAAEATEVAADKIQGTLINKLKLLGNEITGRAMEITRDFAPALTLIGQLGPQAASGIGTLIGALGGLVFPDVKPPGVSVPSTGTGTQVITQEVVRTPAVEKKLTTDIADTTQNITQKITKVEVAPTAAPDAEKAGKVFGIKFTGAFQDALTGTFGTAIGGVAYQVMQRASFSGFMAGLARFIVIPLAIGIAAAAVVALIGAGFYELFTGAMELRAGDITRGLSRILSVILGPAFFGPLGILIGLGAAEMGGDIIGGIINGIVSAAQAFFTPENIGRRLADVVMLALVGLFAVPILLIHFRKPIADMFELMGRLIIGGASALPGLLAGAILDVAKFAQAARQKYIDISHTVTDGIFTALSTSIPGLGVKVGELIAGILFLGPAVVVLIKKGTFDPLIELITEFFTVTLPGLFTVDTFFAVLDAFVAFFGTTLPNAITVEMPKIPGAIVDGLVDLPEQVLTALDLVTETVTGWVGGLESWLSENFSPWNWIKTAALAFVDEIVGWLALIWGSGVITEWVDDLAAWLTENFQPWEWIKAAVTGLPQLILDGLGDLKTLLLQKGADLMQGLWDGAYSVAVAMSLWFLGLPGLVVQWIGDGKWTLAQVGRDIIDGLWRGMQEVWDEVEDWLGGLKSIIPRKKGPPSEDAKILYDNGRLIIQGFQNGMLKTWADVERWLASRGPMIYELFKPIIAKMQASGVDAGQAFSDAFGGTVTSGVAVGIAKSATVVKDSLGKTIADAVASGKSIAQVLWEDVGFTFAKAVASGMSIGIPVVKASLGKLIADAIALGRPVWEVLARDAGLTIAKSIGSVISNPTNDPAVGPIIKPGESPSGYKSPGFAGDDDAGRTPTVAGLPSGLRGTLRHILSGALTSRGTIESAVKGIMRYVDSWKQFEPAFGIFGEASAAFHRQLEKYGLPKSFDDGGVLMPGLTFAWNGTGVPEQVIAPNAGGNSSRSTNYGKQYFIFGPGRQSKDVIRDLDRLIS